MARENYVGGKWVPARSGATDKVVEPATGAVLDEVAASGADDVDDAVTAAAAAFEQWSATTPRHRFEVLTTVADAIATDLPHLQDLEIRNVGKPRSIIDFEMDLTVDNWRFFAAGARFLEGRAAGEYLEDHTSFLRRDPLGVVGSIAPWNYPLNMATWKVGPRARRGQHRGAEAVGADAAVRAAARGDHVRHPAARCPQRRHRRRRAHRRGAREASRRRDGVADRRRRDRQGDRTRGRRLAQARAPRARRQGTGRGVRRRRHRRRGRDPRRGGLLQLGSGLHRAVPRARGAGSLRRPRGRPHRRGRRHRHRRPARGRHRDGPGRVGRSAFTRRGHGRPRPGGGRRGHDRRPRTRRRRASSTSRPSWCNPRRTARSCSARCSGRSSRCSGSPTRTRLSRGRTASTTGWRRVCGPATSAVRCGWRGGCSSAPCGSTTTSRSSPSFPHGGFKQSGYGKDMSIYAIEAYTELKHVMVKL